MSNKKELPGDWLVYIAEKERELKQAPNPTKRHQPKIQRHESRRQRVANGQSNNFVHSVYKDDATATPIRKSTEGLTRDVGGNCEDRNAATGRRTSYRAISESDNKK